jgi:hypothetical protein
MAHKLETSFFGLLLVNGTLGTRYWLEKALKLCWITTGTGMGSFDVKTAKKLRQHKCSDFISKRTDFQLTYNKSGYRLLKTSVMATRITYDFKIQSVRRIFSFTAIKLRFFNFKKRQKKTVVIKKILDVFRGGKTEPITNDLIVVQSK